MMNEDRSEREPDTYVGRDRSRGAGVAKLDRRHGHILKAPVGEEVLYLALAILVVGVVLFFALGPFLASPGRQIVAALLAAGVVFIVRYSPIFVRLARYAVVRARRDGGLRERDK